MPVEILNEELSRPRAESLGLKQLLESEDVQLAQSSLVAASNAALLACKDELLATTAEEVQRLESLATSAESRAASASATIKAFAAEQQHVYDSISNSTIAPLDKDDILDGVLSYVGGCDHLYTGGVNRHWKGRYIQYCASQFSTSLVMTSL
jgi:hypothetical protein